MNILYAEKDDYSYKLMETILKDKHVLRRAEDGVEALESITNNNFDLLMTTMQLPKMDGLKLIKEIRKFDKNLSIYVVSSLYLEDAVLEAYASGADNYIKKPISVNYVKGVVDNLK